VVERMRREKVTTGSTEKIVTGCGEMYVTVNHAPQNGLCPVELFVKLGKAGSCAVCQNEALTRCMSIGLQCGAPPWEFVKTLKGIKCPSATPGTNPEDRILSCADGIAKVLEGYLRDNSIAP